MWTHAQLLDWLLQHYITDADVRYGLGFADPQKELTRYIANGWGAGSGNHRPTYATSNGKVFIDAPMSPQRRHGEAWDLTMPVAKLVAMRLPQGKGVGKGAMQLGMAL